MKIITNYRNAIENFIINYVYLTKQPMPRKSDLAVFEQSNGKRSGSE